FRFLLALVPDLREESHWCQNIVKLLVFAGKLQPLSRVEPGCQVPCFAGETRRNPHAQGERLPKPGNPEGMPCSCLSWLLLGAAKGGSRFGTKAPPPAVPEATADTLPEPGRFRWPCRNNNRPQLSSTSP